MSRMLVSAALLAGLAVEVPATAHDRTMQGCPRRNPATNFEHYTGDDPRVFEEYVDGSRVLVVVPPEYETSGRRYPVVWLFPGGLNFEDCYLTDTDLLAFTKDQPDDQQAIIAIPDGRPSNHWIDARDGSLKDETRFLAMFVPGLDDRYRTIPDGRHRAIAGFSSGGLGAMHIAARYPDRFAASASFEGWVVLNETDWFGLVIGTGLYAFPVPGRGTPGPGGYFGDPVTEAVWWRDTDPTSLAPNFGGTQVTLFARDAIPCDPSDAHDMITTPVWPLGNEARRQNDLFSAALQGAGVSHVYDRTGCGLHTYPYVGQWLHLWWPRLFDAFGTPPPASFDHRRAAGSFSVWGWTFEADSERRAEFLDVSGASCNGLEMKGSGLTGVTTGSCFAPGKTISLTGAVEPSAIADEEGRISFTVDLGPAHTMQQYTIEQRAAEALGGYWTTRTVEFG